jgi:hypothetical protein
MSEYINSQVDEILIGAEIQESFYDEKQDRHYSLARINKFVTQRDLKKKMDDIDDEMSSLLAKNHRLAYSKLLKLFEKRKAHNQIYIVVKNRFYPRKFERRTIEELRLSSRVPKKKIKIVESGKLKGSLKTIIDSLKSELVLVGHEIVNDGPDQVLWIKANKRKEFLNVKGFEKWSFSIHITNNEKDSSKGGIFIKKSKVGRDEKDAFLKIEKEIQTELKTEIEKLNL